MSCSCKEGQTKWTGGKSYLRVEKALTFSLRTPTIINGTIRNKNEYLSLDVFTAKAFFEVFVLCLINNCY